MEAWKEVDEDFDEVGENREEEAEEELFEEGY